MGACLCKSDKGLHGPPQPPVAELQSDTEGQPIVEGDNQPSNGTISEEKIRESYTIGELATSSLLGLVATVKEHITKPTAMAQGRVAHLIEWKGWGCGGGDGGAGIGWAGTGGRWTGAGASLQEDEQFYSHLTDEIKEARFAAGVAQQFALAEAAMIAWSSEDVPDGSKRSSAPLQDADNRFLSQYLLNSQGTEVPPLLYGNNPDTSIDPSPFFHPLPPHAPWQPEAEQAQQKQGVSPADTSIRHADSISLSEDEVFYN